MKGCHGNSSEKFNPGTQSFNMAGADVSQDLHLKMSKKIAQLTKVIYALNTRNDEHEAVVLEMKDVHEREMQQVLGETKEKIAHYQGLIGNEMESRRKITRLEECAHEYERQRSQALKEFQTFKDEVAKHEEELVRSQANRVQELTRHLDEYKTSYETAVSRFDTLASRFETAKNTALEKLRAEHHKEIQEIYRTQEDMQRNLSGTTEQLQAKYQADMAALQHQLDQEETRRMKEGEEAEGKLRKAQAFYERELDAARQAQNKEATEQLAQLTKQHEELRGEYHQTQSQHKKRVDELLNKIASGEEMIEQLHGQIKSTSSTADEKDRKIQRLVTEIESKTSELDSLKSQLQDLRIEVTTSQEREKEQKKEIVRKSKSIGELQAKAMQHESKMAELNQELQRMRERLGWLEKERKESENSAKSKTSEIGSQMKSLEDALKTATEDLERQKQRYEREMAKITDQATKAERDLRRSMETDLEKARAKAEKEALATEKEHKREKESLTKDYQAKLEEEEKRSKATQKEMSQEMEKLRKELSAKLKEAEKEIARLEALTREKDNGLGSVASNLEHLQATNQRLAEEAAQAKEECRLAKSQANSLKLELDKLREKFEVLQRENKVDLNAKLNELSTELDRKWSDTLRRECGHLRSELNETAALDKKTALDQLAKMKDGEIMRLKGDFGMRKEQMESDLKELRSKVVDLENALKAESDKANRAIQEESGKLREILRQTELDRDRMIGRIETECQMEVTRLKDALAKEQSEMRANAEMRLHEERSVMETAHQSYIQELKREADEMRQRQVDELTNRLSRERDELRADLMVRFGGEMEEHSQEFREQMKKMQKEREELRERARVKELELSTRIDSMKSELNAKQRALAKMEGEVNKLESGLTEMSKELEQKGKEILHIRSDATQKLKHLEHEISARYDDELNRHKQNHQTDCERLLTEFNEAQGLLKDKISEFKLLLAEAEDRYRNRESREEDLDLIAQLKESIASKEKEIMRLVEEKKYYQMELVNRETNFNKVFSTSPQVGVMNPLAGQTNTATRQKKGSIDKGKNGVSQRLAPLPNSPFHDDAINPSKPLPPPSRKFMA